MTLFKRIKNLWNFFKIASAFETGDFFDFIQKQRLEGYKQKLRDKYNLDPTVKIGHGTQIYGKGNISIGKNSYLGYNCHIQCDPEEANIIIGEGCAIAHNVHMRTTSYPKTFSLKDARKMKPSSDDIIIGDDVWIGCHVFINPGITIGKNSIIGANSVVTKNVAANTVVGGVPARLIAEKIKYA